MPRRRPAIGPVHQVGATAGRTPSAIQRAFHVLELLAERPCSAAEVSRAIGVNRSTALRLLRDLEGTGYVVRDAALRSFATQPGRFFALVAAHGDHTDWSEAIDPLLVALRDEFGEASMLGVPANGTMVYLAYFPSSQPVAVREQLGTVRPMHASALGKAYLAALPPEVLDTELARLSFRDSTPAAAKGPIELRERLVEIRDRGYAVDRNETFDEVTCLAASVRFGVAIIGAIGVSAPSARFTEQRVARVGTRVSELAQSISGGLR